MAALDDPAELRASAASGSPWQRSARSSQPPLATTTAWCARHRPGGIGRRALRLNPDLDDRSERAAARLADLEGRKTETAAEIERLSGQPAEIDPELSAETLSDAESRPEEAADALAAAESVLGEADRLQRETDAALAVAREARIRAGAVGADQPSLASENLFGVSAASRTRSLRMPASPPMSPWRMRTRWRPSSILNQERERIGPVNLRADQEVEELEQRIEGMENERDDLIAAIGHLRSATSQ